MNESSFKKLISKVYKWVNIPVGERKKIIREFVSDEAAIGTQKEQNAYREAVSKQDEVVLKKLNKQAENRRKKALEWLSRNGH